jgi:TolB protein
MRYVLILFFAVNLFAIDATLEVIKKVKYTPTIMIQDASRGNGVRNTLIRKFHKILIGDFQVGGSVRPKSSYTIADLNEEPSYGSLKEDSVDLLLRYDIRNKGNGGLSVDIRLFNTGSKKLIMKGNYSVSSKSRFPFLAHHIAIAINKHLGASPIDWMSRFVIFSKAVGSGRNNIVLADYTLTYKQTIVKGGLNLFPKWANKEQNSFYYTSLSGVPTLYKVDLYKGKKRKIISSSGMLVCSDVSSDGKKLLLTMAPDDQPEVYLYNTVNRYTSKITNFKGIDVGGKFIDGDRRIAFVSDRFGYPNIFAKTIGGRAIERLVYHGRNNNSCTTSGSYIAYVSRDKESEFTKSFNIYLISTRSDYIRQLTSTGKNQFPNFSQDGETIMFIKNYKNQNAIGIIRINFNKTFLFPLNVGKIQSIDW